MLEKMEVGCDQKEEQAGQEDGVEHVIPGQSDYADSRAALEHLDEEIAD